MAATTRERLGATILVRGGRLGLDAERLWSSVALAAPAVALWTLLGIGIGTLIRNQVAAILIAVFVTFLVEPLATYFLGLADLDDVVRWLSHRVRPSRPRRSWSFLDYLDWWAGGLVLLGYALILAGFGVRLSVRRDVT